MNSGSFFRLDLETSKVVSGVTYFNYLDVPDLNAQENELRHPIKLSISSDRVSFYVHYFKDNYSPHHLEDVILDLQYKSDDPNCLASTIKRIYNTDFPLSDFLVKLLSDRYIIENKAYEALKKSQINKDSYSSLYVWGLLKNQESDNSSYCIQDDRTRITKFLRKLLLDFMFDLMHSDVFESSKYYSQMRKGLMSDFFFSAIVKKCEYYYYRRLVRNRLESVLSDSEYLLNYSSVIKKIDRVKQMEANRLARIQKRITQNEMKLSGRSDTMDEKRKEITSEEFHRIGFRIAKDEYRKLTIRKRYEKRIGKAEAVINNHESTNSVLYSIKKLYAEKLDDAESSWIDTIMNPKSDELFTFSPEWYEDQKTRKKQKGFSVSESWFVNPEEEMARVVFPLMKVLDEEKEGRGNDNETTKIHYLNSFELGNLIGTKDNSSVLSRNTKVSKWYYRRFDFVDTFRLHFFRDWNHIFASLLFIFSIVAILPCYWIWDSPRNLSVFPIAASLGFFVTAIVFNAGISKMKSLRHIDDVLLKNRRIREVKRCINYGLVFLLTWCFLFFYEVLSDNFWLFLAKLFVWGCLSVLLLCIHPHNYIINNIHILLPRLVASITTAWVMLVIGNDLVKEHLSWPVCIVIITVVFVFILYENNKNLPNISTGARIWRALELMLISYSIALVVGVFAIDVLSPSFIVDAKPYLEEAQATIGVVPPLKPPFEKPISADWVFLKGNRDLIITFFPKYLIQFSFLAMFIGVFIQMIFEEKSITEM